MTRQSRLILCIGLLMHFGYLLAAQSFYFGADLSYVNEMEDCGVIYKENQSPKDPFQIFADHNCNLVRLRLWHTPAWYDDLNSGERYSDFTDVKRSIARAKEQGMEVLLDFHLSDNWADPGKQIVPAAWLGVVNDLPKLKDSLYAYITSTLLALHQEDLLPEMVQIGNETNKGILLSPEDNSNSGIDWNRNSQLFNRAIQAIEVVELITQKEIKIAIHVAGPDAGDWLINGFIENGVTDFEVIGISYYWAWHQPTTIEQTGQIIGDLRTSLPDKEVIIFETGYIWTTEFNDNANNIINATHPDYSPPSPQAQKQWLIDLTTEVIEHGGSGVIYWEPAWVSSSCWTQWGQGSHQEHATFFDFDNNLIDDGGISWMEESYPTSINTILKIESVSIFLNQSAQQLIIKDPKMEIDTSSILQINNLNGQTLFSSSITSLNKSGNEYRIRWPEMPPAIYVVSIWSQKKEVYSKKINYIK